MIAQKEEYLNSKLRSVLAVVIGVIAGSAVNMGIVMISSYIIPPPEGTDVTTVEGLKEALHLFQPKHFIMPFLAHALGTFFGSIVTAHIVQTHKMKFALGIGIWFLLGGIMNVVMLPSPTWFTLVDLLFAYLPFAYFAGMISGKSISK